MGDAGLSKTRLGRMHEVLAGHVARGVLPGLVALVSRRGEVHVELVAILMTQRAGFPQGSPVHLDFWTSVCQAIDD
jgi:hypothetical protein